MSIKKYTNFEDINLKTKNEGQFIEEKDLFIVSNNQIEDADFGECHYDVMEVSVYDINNNLLPQKSGNNVAYIKAEDIKNYLYRITKPNIALPDGMASNELAIDAEKLLKHLGFKNGILRININFVRSRVGNENVLRRAWIQEISATRQEIRILPLKTKFDDVNQANVDEFSKIKNLNKDFKYYKKTLLDNLSSYENIFLDKINTHLETKFGKDFFSILKKDFGLSNFGNFRKKIFDDFTESVTYYLTNRYYDIEQSNFGQFQELRFDDCEQYDFKMMTDVIEDILSKCIRHNSYFLKRRGISTAGAPKEFKIVELTKAAKDNLNAFATVTDIKRNVYAPDKVNVVFDDPKQQPPVIVVKDEVTPSPPPTPPPPPPPPPKISMYYYYRVENRGSRASMEFEYINVAGAVTRKLVAPGANSTICARVDSVSAVNSPSVSAATAQPAYGRITGNSQDDRRSATYHEDDDGYDYGQPQEINSWNITKLEPCNTIDITPHTSPTPPPRTPPVPPIRPTTYTPPTPATTSGGCFVEGTIVTLANGAKIAIEEVVRGMEVLTWNEESGQQEAGIVTDLIRPMSSDIISIELGDESIECTTDHPIFVVGKGWASFNPIKTKEVHKMEVTELVDGDLVLNSSDETVVIHSIVPIMMLAPIQTYNLSIEGNHTYYANGILVHNKLATPVTSGGSGAGSNTGYTPDQYEPGYNNNTGMPVRGGSTGGGPTRLTTAND